MPTEAHPTRDEILAYTTGRLDEPSSERIAEHRMRRWCWRGIEGAG
jgi:hypothetical protein